MNPRLDFLESEFAFGCDLHENLDTKPFAVEFVSRFVDKGKRTASPDPSSPNYDVNHYTDRDQYYHIVKQEKQRSVGQHFIVGFLVKTREVGVYKPEVWITTEEMQGIHRDLVIRVEHPQKASMKCSRHWFCNIRPRVKVVG